MKSIYLTIFIALLSFNSANAADVTGDIRTVPDSIHNSDGGYLEFGIGINMDLNGERINMRTIPVLAGAYRYRGFFVEALSLSISLDSSTVGGLTMGYNVWRNDRWAVDILGVNSRWRLSTRTLEKDPLNSSDPEREDALLSRRSIYHGAGVRLTGYMGNAIFQFRLTDDIYCRNGLTSSTRLGYSKQIKNWNLHGLVGAEYISKKTGQYWYGVAEEESTARFQKYEFDSSSVSFTSEIGAAFPIRENIVFRSSAHYMHFADDITASPLQEGEY